MRLTLKNFRKWEDKSFDFGDGVVKVTGESGAGKSTIFEAIYWCLYGRLQKVGTKGSKGRTEVQLEIPEAGIIVHRWGQKAVSYTQASSDNGLSKNSTSSLDETWEGDEAQSRIDRYFGPHELFLMASYMRAETPHPLLMASPAEKRELTGLIFPDASKYDRYRGKLNELRHQDEANMASIGVEIKRLEASLHTLEGLEEFKVQVVEPIEDVKGLRDGIQLASKELEEAKRAIAIYGSLQDQIHGLGHVEPISNMDDIEPMKIRLASSRTWNVRLDLLQDRLQELKRDLQQKMEQIQGLVNRPISSLEDLNTLSTLYDQLISLAPSAQSLDIEIQNIASKHEKASKLLMQYEQSLLAIEHNEHLDDILECPNCKIHLLHMEDGLVPCQDHDLNRKEVSHQVSQADIMKQRVQVARLNDGKQDLMEKYNRYKKLLVDACLRSQDETMDIQSMRTIILDIRRLKGEESSLESKISEASKDTREYISPEDKKAMESRIKEIETKDMEFKAFIKQKSSLEARIQSMASSRPWISDAQEYLQKIQDRIQDLQTRISMVESMTRAKGIHAKHHLFQVKLEEALSSKSVLEKHLMAIAKAETILVDTYKDYVGIKLKDIEYDVSTMAKLFFDQSMNILLIPGKDSASGNPRPSFDLDIEYGGIRYDDIRLMSTGERKRLSLILMMVISVYTGGKMFLLDEALNSIGAETRGIIMNEISHLELPTMITSHDDIPGGYAYEIIL